MKFKSNFNKKPVVPVKGREKDCVTVGVHWPGVEKGVGIITGK